MKKYLAFDCEMGSRVQGRLWPDGETVRMAVVVAKSPDKDHAWLTVDEVPYAHLMLSTLTKWLAQNPNPVHWPWGDLPWEPNVEHLREETISETKLYEIDWNYWESRDLGELYAMWRRNKDRLTPLDRSRAQQLIKQRKMEVQSGKDNRA
jgi:hypothetical protein